LCGEYSPATRKKSANLFSQYEHAVDWTYKGGMHEGNLGDKLADYVFEEWKKHAHETYAFCFPRPIMQEAADERNHSAQFNQLGL
jgi:hypothetical protein